MKIIHSISHLLKKPFNPSSSSFSEKSPPQLTSKVTSKIVYSSTGPGYNILPIKKPWTGNYPVEKYPGVQQWGKPSSVMVGEQEYVIKEQEGMEVEEEVKYKTKSFGKEPKYTSGYGSSNAGWEAKKRKRKETQMIMDRIPDIYKPTNINFQIGLYRFTNEHFTNEKVQEATGLLVEVNALKDKLSHTFGLIYLRPSEMPIIVDSLKNMTHNSFKITKMIAEFVSNEGNQVKDISMMRYTTPVFDIKDDNTIVAVLSAARIESSLKKRVISGWSKNKNVTYSAKPTVNYVLKSIEDIGTTIPATIGIEGQYVSLSQYKDDWYGIAYIIYLKPELKIDISLNVQVFISLM